MLEGLRRFLRPAPELPAEAYALTAHFKARGIDVEPKSLKPRKRGLEAAFELRIPGYPLSILVLSCVDVPTAERFVDDGGDRARVPDTQRPSGHDAPLLAGRGQPDRARDQGLCFVSK